MVHDRPTATSTAGESGPWGRQVPVSCRLEPDPAVGVRDTDQAVTVAQALALAGLDVVEIGDPLLSTPDPKIDWNVGRLAPTQVLGRWVVTWVGVG